MAGDPDYRRSYGSLAARAYRLDEVRAYMGHADLTMTCRPHDDHADLTMKCSTSTMCRSRRGGSAFCGGRGN